ncbi:MaoC family dehydratase N-terminal domain-containing protein [Aquamicrobium sp. LC103]|uniref:FAS1-like dehydratase domain-containing protein n=1 Tax=Aquamicrobium sp. LC103 TaxID=1120658 RepID=UPI001FED2E42|nr:MaoC family dehydratase N-terminal domain-containing protein [Aquamicrobium sp. LC103]
MDLQDWIGRTSEAEDIVTPRLLASFSAMLAPHLAASSEGEAPVGLHWCLAPEIAEARELGDDGHPAKGGFLPPVPLPRRMWAAGDLRFLAPLRPGDRVRRRSTVSKIEEKHGQSGRLVFVTVRHEAENENGPVIDEDHVIVYREAGGPSRPAPAAASPTEPAPHQQEIEIDPVLLFRYSALTFNGHRIHYDAPYAREVEGYQGLVIHGPLQATLLMNFAATIGGRAPRRFSFRGVHPATGTQKLLLRATPGEDDSLALEVLAADGHITMKAAARW